MCTNSPDSPPLAPPPPPPPPPPLPPPPLPTSSNTSVKSFSTPYYSKQVQEILEQTYLCYWAASDFDLKRACIFSQICPKDPPHKIIYTKLEPITQVGPTCGLVALSMVIYGKVDPDEILKMAKSEGYTCNGEMFSCENMAKLSEQVFRSADIKAITVKVHHRSLFSWETVESLLKGDILLVPYDADVNFTPALKNGHTAHWAVICGVILVKKPSAPYTAEKENIYVLSQHGKSKCLAAWNLAKLAQSNNNLWEWSPKKQIDGLHYMIPEGGIGGKNGLRGQYLTLQGRS